jgi:hypothetical protein
LASFCHTASAQGTGQLAVLPTTDEGTNEQANPQIDTHTCTRIEESLETVWANVLPINQIDVDDNFFELGRYTLLAKQLDARTH